ncbi:MAG: methyltransferase [Crocinitomicaceae bacterium]|jgi:TfoX/Sxy family transcriptional regulator of competence genes|nr:methyltransferase [Crocinitomicaceae bacterium]
MAYNETLALRIARRLAEFQVDFAEKKMFGGIAFMVNDKMCAGVTKEQMMLRVMDEHYDGLLEENHVHSMQFTGKTMRGFLFIDQEAFETDPALERFINYGLEFGEKGILKSKKK